MVSKRSSEPFLMEFNAVVQALHLSSPELKSYMPKDHFMQVVQQMTVTGANYAVYTCTTEVAVLFTIILYSPTDMLAVVRGRLFDIENRSITWAYTSVQNIPDFAFN